MKKIIKLFLVTLLLFAFVTPVQAQRGFIKRKIRKDMKEKHAEPEREKGREAIKDITYENDKRYPVPENPVKATLVIETRSYKNNGKLKETMITKMVFGDTGECMIMNEGNKNETRLLFDYKGAATYMINQKEKMATKMPMINFKKMAEGIARNYDDLETNNGEWKRTDEQKEINGFHCRKYIYLNTKEKTKTHVWVTKDISIDLSGNHLFGGQIKDFSEMYKTTNTKKTENYPQGMMVRSVYFEKNKDIPNMQMDFTTLKNTSDSKYFDLSNYKVYDVLDRL